jgi:5-methylcytosine-specific restriction endonuclease McrA
VANGDPAIVFERALGLLLEHLERTRTAKTTRPRAGVKSKPDSRHIPAAVKRAVWERDKGCCAFKGSRGRCTETGLLEYHHVVPFAEGGKTTSDNLELRCRAHNQYEADLWFGASETRGVREEPAAYRS